MTTTPTLAEVVRRLTLVLGAVGDALRDGHADALLATDGELGRTLRSLAAFSPSDATPDVLADLRDTLNRSAAALARCRRLGASLEHLALATLTADDRAGGYTRAGQAVVVSPSGALEARA